MVTSIREDNDRELNKRQFTIVDILLMLVIAVGFGVLIYLLSSTIDASLLGPEKGNVWFEADIDRIFANMTDRWSDHYRTQVHPLFSLVSFPLYSFINFVSGLDAVNSIRLVSALLAAIWSGLVFAVLRGIGCQRLDALLFTLLGVTSAASIFWFSVPETYAWGSLTILIALGFVVLTQTRQFSWPWYSAVSAITFSMTITNWMAGLLVVLTKYPGFSYLKKLFNNILKRQWSYLSIPSLWKSWVGFLVVNFSALVIVLVLALVQRQLFPTSAINFFNSKGELEYVGMDNSGGPFRCLTSLLLHTIVMPQIQVSSEAANSYGWSNLLTQLSPPGSGSIWGAIAVGLWLGLLVLGVWSFFKVKGNTKLRFVLGFTLLGQIALHLVYGNETFLYSLHILPLLVLLVAFISLTSFRLIGLVATGALILLISLNNAQQFQFATDFLQRDHDPTPREAVRIERLNRSSDPWPRGVGHVVLGVPGSYEEEKAYHEPGGSFSPTANSFGVSLWIRDAAGSLVATSDDIPLDKIQQKLVREDQANIPGILTETEFYDAVWHNSPEGHWQLKLMPKTTEGQSISLLVRSVGPAGGPIDTLMWDGQSLRLNQTRRDLCTIAKLNQDVAREHPLLSEVSHKSLADRCNDTATQQLQWKIYTDQSPEAVHIGHEGDTDWVTASATGTTWQGNDGWGFARFDLAGKDDVTLTIERVNPPAMAVLPDTPDTFDLSLPDQQFVDSLLAQVSHLEMSLVENQTRPGEPLNYPLPWQRDGAYTLAALARAGQIDVAKSIALYFAENDFFGGFGPEADAPGLSIWAIEQVAQQSLDPDFDQQVWPHIKRKAEFIEQMLSATEPIHQSVSAPVLLKVMDDPELNLVADPAADGLIMGRMDHHRPLLFVNAVSYRGLLDASAMAARLGHTAEQNRWQEAANQLQKAWSEAFQGPEAGNERTFIAGLWPTWVAAADLNAYQEKLDERLERQNSSKTQGTYQPLWTYFEIAQAHQWLYLGELEPVWDTLNWFWQHQASPGLYTWWEGKGEENTSHFWEYMRGWTEPTHVTPHYWTASEILLLQLDMLAYVDQSASTPKLIVAGGVPGEWFNQPMHVDDLLVNGRLVSWDWDGTSFKVNVEGEPIEVELGPNVPAKAKVAVVNF